MKETDATGSAARHCTGNGFAPWLGRVRRHLQETGHRCLVCLSGEALWARTVAADVPVPGEHALWIGGHGPSSRRWSVMETRAARDVLGTETDVVAWDAWSGFDPDGFGAVSGCVRAGGILLLLCPELESWHRFADPQHARIAVDGYAPEQVSGRFLRRIARCFQEDDRVFVLRETDAAMPSLPAGADTAGSRARAGTACLGDEQRRAVAGIVRVLEGRRRRPLVLTADRGRGKSAALGIAAARLLARNPTRRILLTAPRREQCEAVYRHAAGADLPYWPPAELAEALPPADLVLVDEAAGISPTILEPLLRHYNRIVFSSTIHGYEGTGRGFAIRFRAVLDKVTPQWHSLRLEEPVRWAPNDPLEAVTFRALLLNATPAAVSGDCSPADTRHRMLDRDALAENDELLGEVFGLLVQAHYRTRPVDLRNLLDGPGLQVHVRCLNGHPVAVALVAEEGGFPAAMAQAIWDGRRRPRGHLLSQALAAHVGLRQGARVRCLRVMRIAVHPLVQGRGIGSSLLEDLLPVADSCAYGLIGTSFGATPALVGFWRRNGYIPLRVGMRRDAASGAHSVLMVRPLDARCSRMVRRGRSRFRRELPLHLGDALRDLDPDLVDAVLAGFECEPRPAAADWRDLAAFAGGRRAFESTLASLYALARWALTTPVARAHLSVQDRRLLILRLLQSRPWNRVAGMLDLAGRPAIVAALRRLAADIVDAHGDPAARQLLRWYRQVGSDGDTGGDGHTGTCTQRPG